MSRVSDFVEDMERRWRDIELGISDLEIRAHRDSSRMLTQFMVRKVHNAVVTELTRPFRSVLGMQGRAKE